MECSLRGQHLAPAGDLGAEVRGQLTMQVTDQTARAGRSRRLLVRRQLLEGRDRRACAVMFQDQLEPALGTDTVVEGDLDDRPQSFVVFGRAIVANGSRHRLGFGDRPIIGPGCRDVAGIEMPRPTSRIAATYFSSYLLRCWFG